MRRLSTITKVEQACLSPRLWRLTLSCGHMAYEKTPKKPSIWDVPMLGRRRRKRCRHCEAQP